MRHENFAQTVYLINWQNEIEEMPYYEYLTSFHNDNTTSPRGVEHRRQVASVIVKDGAIIDHDLNDRRHLSDSVLLDGEEIKWAVYSWGVRGSGPAKLDSELFDQEEDAEEDILKGMEHDYLNLSSDAPSCFFTREEAEEVLKELKEREEEA